MKITVINGSPKGKYSITLQTVLYLEKKYPEAVFALKILSNPFVPDRELGAIRMEAYSAILNGDSISSVQYKYDRQMDAYVTRHNWD